MAIITLTTDLGLVDNYVASVKGAILKEDPKAVIVDITHEIPSFDLQKSAFVLRNCYQDFPEGSIHIIGVNSESDLEIYSFDYSLLDFFHCKVLFLCGFGQPSLNVELKCKKIELNKTTPNTM